MIGIDDCGPRYRSAVVEAMRSRKWLRTQWIARAAFGLGRVEWKPRHAARVLTVLRELRVTGVVERRDGVEQKRGSVAGVRLSFQIPRHEWRLTPAPSDPRSRATEGAALAIVIERLPNPLTDEQLVEWMTMAEDAATPERISSIRRAVRDLIAVGLLTCDRDGLIRPTAAARRTAELELGM